MTKAELIELIESLKVVFNEGIQNDKDKNIFPRIVLTEVSWNDLSASGQNYTTEVEYQVSFFSNIPRHEKLLLLKSKLNERGIKVPFYHEYLLEEKMVHTALVISVLENV